jgi:hypothetical protein
MRKMALFIWLIIRLIQLVFSAGTVFFSQKKSANSVFQPAYNYSRTGPISNLLHDGFSKLGLLHGSFGVLLPKG